MSAPGATARRIIAAHARQRDASASELARQLGLTRNQVISALTRWVPDWVVEHKNGKPKAGADAGPAGGLFPPRGYCVYPHGHPREPDFRFCGEKVEAGKPYCTPCCEIAYQRPKIETEAA